MWAFMEGWLTPGSLFIFLNLMIGTIFLTSRLNSPRKAPNHHLGPDGSAPLARAPSLLDRVRSIDFSLYKFGHPGGGYPEPEPARYEQHSYPEHGYAGPVDAPPLARAPSLLDRFKSINFSLYKFDHPAGYPEPEPVPVQGSSYPEAQFSHRDGSPPLARAPSLVDRLKSFDFSLYKFQAPSDYTQPQAHHDERPWEPEYADGAEPPRLARAPSFLERVKSIDFSSFYRSSEPDPDADALHRLGADSASDSEDDDDDSVPNADAGRVRQDHKVRRVRSDPKAPTPGEAPARLPAKMKKSASERSAVGHFEEEDIVERRRPETAREGGKRSGAAAAPPEEEGDEIDAKADAFINRFKQHLKLQRLDSIIRYKEMLSRGAS